MTWAAPGPRPPGYNKTASNIHMSRAGAVRGLDVNTVMVDEPPRFSFVNIEPGRGADGSYPARWFDPRGR